MSLLPDKHTHLDCCSRNHPVCFCILLLHIIMREWVNDLTPFCENTHIQKYACCMKQDPVFFFFFIKFLDNHESHCSLHAAFTRQSGIVMVTFPLNCAHRQQILDVTVMGTFKAKYTVTENEWMMPILEKNQYP